MDRGLADSNICGMHKYKTALVVGCGRSGRAAEALLRSEGCTVISICQESTPDYRYEDIHFDPDVAVVSPGFSLKHPWITDLIELKIPLLSELELGWSRRHCPVIAVTGSNGKSTVVKWIVDALAQAGQLAVPCGNYGFPVCGAVMLPKVPDWLVIEVSSFQLETVQEFRPDIGLLLNVLPNHLDRHGTMESYRDLKLRLFENMLSTDTAVVPCDMFPSIDRKGSNDWKTFGTEADADFRYQDEIGRAHV
jgi:UDP-N-acetylmuramoylalanine--D-glutamate ligase